VSDLERFVSAQEGVYETALAELTAGEKRSHWMWFIFPQFAGLGHSAMARHYAIGSLAEARDYLDHPLLGSRLRACTAAVLSHPNRSAEGIFGTIDALKFRSSMTLFEAVEPAADFSRAIEAFYESSRDERTLALLG
jgi:uncharacterized protein (DUF1810 family)